MRHRILACAAAVLILVPLAGGCFGPQKFTRHMDDWYNQFYVDNPWLAGNTVSAVLMRVVFFVTELFDDLLVNPIDFWLVSAWPFGHQGHGTPFHHKNPVVPVDR